MTTNDQTWLKVTPTDSLPPREGRCVEIAGCQVAIFNTAEGFIAVENRCPHRGGPLADGIVNGTAVVCPLHAWKFDLLSGVSINHPEASAALVKYPTRVEDGIVCIELPQATGAEEAVTFACEHRDRPIRWVHRKSSPLTGTGDPVGASSSLNANPPRTDTSQGNGYAPQEL